MRDSTLPDVEHECFSLDACGVRKDERPGEATPQPSLPPRHDAPSGSMDEAYEPRSVLLTGGCGFIGSNVVNYLVRRYPDVMFVNVDRLDYCANLKSVDVADRPNYRFYRCDINNSEMISHLLSEHSIDTIIHFAAQSHVDNSFGNALQFTRDNIMGTHTLLECAKYYGGIRRFIHISTDEVYGEVDLEHEGCSEKSILNPTNPYAATKASAEYLVRSYHFSFKLPVIITRGNNVYGPRQYPEKLIPRFIKLLRKGKKCTVHGAGQSIRNFIHVDDVCRAVDCILTRGHVGQIYNIGTDNEYSVLQIADLLVKRLRPGDRLEQWLEYVEDRHFNDRRYAINSDNLKRLGWQEQTRFSDGLEQTVQWYLDHPDHWAPSVADRLARP